VIISFGWTTPALLAGIKTVTRRDWNPKHAARFHAGDLIDAWNTSPRNIRGSPCKVATIRLTNDPYQEWTNEAPEDDYEKEGFRWLEEHGLTINGISPGVLWDRWDSPFEHQCLWVVRFQLIEVTRPLPGLAVQI